MRSFGAACPALAPPCLSTRTRSDHHFPEFPGAGGTEGRRKTAKRQEVKHNPVVEVCIELSNCCVKLKCIRIHGPVHCIGGCVDKNSLTRAMWTRHVLLNLEGLQV